MLRSAWIHGVGSLLTLWYAGKVLLLSFSKNPDDSHGTVRRGKPPVEAEGIRALGARSHAAALRLRGESGIDLRRLEVLPVHGGADQLYDLERDPEELENVIEEHPEVAERLRKKTLGLWKTSRERGSGLRVKRDAPPQLIEALRSLGYVE